MGVPPLVAAKLAAPVPPLGFVARERLHTALDASCGTTATVVAGPAGVGKSALLAGWTATLGPGVTRAWVNADPDDTAGRLLRHLAWAIGADERAPDIREGVREALQRPRSHPLVVVIDDAHLIRCRHALDALRWVVEVGAAHVHLVLAGRTDPLVALRWGLADRGVVVLGGRDLDLTEAEADRMITTRPELDLSPAVRAALVDRADGWVVALHLALSALAASDDPAAAAATFGAGTPAMADYLVGEILEPLGADLGEVLVSASVLDDWTVESCRAVTGREDAHDLLAGLADANLLVGRRAHGSFRCHPLLREQLCQRLRASDDARHRRLQRVAAALAERSGDLPQAVAHLVQAEDAHALRELCHRHPDALARTEAAVALRDGVRRLPTSALGRVDDQLAVAEVQLHAGDPAGCALRLEHCRAGALPSARARVATLLGRCHHHLGNPGAALAHARAARALATPADPPPPSVGVDEAFGLLWEGRFGDAARRLAGADADDPVRVGLAARLAAEVGELGAADLMARSVLGTEGASATAPTTRILHALVARAQVLVERAQDAAAGRAVDDVIVAARSVGATDALLVAGELQARLRWTDIGVAAGLGVLDRLPRRGRGGPLDPALQARLDRIEARLLIEAGSAAEVGGLAEADALLDRMDGPEALVLRARLASRRGQVGPALDLLDEVPAEARHLVVEVARARLRVLADAGSPDAVGAARHLVAHRSAAQQLRRLLEEGEAVRSVLASVPGTGAGLAAMLERLHRSALVTTLSDRELTILEYLPTRLTSQEIGDQLYISANTVKTHLKNLYRRLDVSRREDAVHRARALGLLPPERADLRLLDAVGPSA